MQTYFESLYPSISYSWISDDAPGLRKSQQAAIHSIAGHFAVRSDVGIVTMPTGSGKSAVMAMSPFVLRSRRCLIVASSKVVRLQLADDLKELQTLRSLAVLPDLVTKPRTLEVVKRITTEESWRTLEDYDLVVAMPQTVSPAYNDIPAPPEDLFDVVLFDEAHHVAAATWTAIRQSFPDAKIILFTATPFRRDRKELPGRFLYSYSVAEAYRDGVYSKIDYEPVIAGDDSDAAIASAAIARLSADWEAGHPHRLIVRTVDLDRAEALLSLYQTRIAIEAVSSRKSPSQIRATLRALRDGELDGVVCVDMLAEGFDFPELKVAALHSPHKSLETTLQFVGRLARATRPDLGTSSVFAVPAEIRIEATELFKEGAIWSELIPNLSTTRLDEEMDLKSTVEALNQHRVQTDPEEDVSLYALAPSLHAYVVRCLGEVNLEANIKWPGRAVQWDKALDPDSNCRIDITLSRAREIWSQTDAFIRESFGLVMTYYDADAALLFINASDRSPETYAQVCKALVGELYEPLTMAEIDDVLGELAAARCFQVGIRPTNPHADQSSYIQYTGSNADDGVPGAEAQGSVLGHVFARGKVGDRLVTKGCSASSRVWASKREHIANYIKWCKHQASLIGTGASIATHSNFDNIGRSARAHDLPAHPVAMDWVTQEVWTGRYSFRQGTEGIGTNLLDCQLTIDHNTVLANSFEFDVSDGVVSCRCKLTAGELKPITIIGGQVGFFIVDTDTDTAMSLEVFLNDERPSVILANGSTTNGWDENPAHYLVWPEMVDSDFLVVEWRDEAVAIQDEVDAWVPEAQSVQQWTEHWMSARCEVVLSDHGTGESADYVGYRRNGDRIELELAHCKASGTDTPGCRLSDLYELCGQAIKNLRFCDPNELDQHLHRRVNKGIARLCKGSRADWQAFRNEVGRKLTTFSVKIIQPGLARTALDDEARALIGFCKESCHRGSRDFLVVCSESRSLV